jgi:hypothetical protein
MFLSACVAAPPLAPPPPPMPPEAKVEAPKPITVWEGLAWGMTRKEIVAQVPQAKDYTVRFGKQKAATFFGIQDYDLDGCPAQVTFLLPRGHLTHILLSFETAAQYRHCENDVIRNLSRKYGRPVATERQRREKVAIRSEHWMTAEAQIHCDAMSVVLTPSDAALIALTVTYLPPAAATHITSAGAAGRG